MKKAFFTIPLICLFSLSAYAGVPQGGEILFDIYRNGEPFGTHEVRFEENGDRTEVLINIDMSVSFGPLDFFKYSHENREVWRGAEIISMDSQTYDNGKRYEVSAEWGEKLTVETQDDRYVVAPMFTTSYWNPDTLSSERLLNTQKGEVEDVRVRYVGEEEFETGRETLRADHYKIDASLPIDIWYDSKTRQWVGLRFNVRGSELEYKRVSPVGENVMKQAEVAQ